MGGQVYHKGAKKELNDLIKEVKNATIYRGKWSKLELDSMIKFFENDSITNQIACDFDSDEEICGFFKGSQLVAYVHIYFPIGFAIKEFHCFAAKFDNSINIVEIDDFTAPLWCVDLEILKTVAPEITWNASVDAVNPDCFSIDDFRFATH